MSVRRPAVLPITVGLVYAAILAPLVVVIGVSLNAGSGFDFPPQGLSLRWYQKFFSSSAFLTAFFQVSLVVGLLASSLATLIGGLAAIAIMRFRFAGRALLEAFF